MRICSRKWSLSGGNHRVRMGYESCWWISAVIDVVEVVYVAYSTSLSSSSLGWDCVQLDGIRLLFTNLSVA